MSNKNKVIKPGINLNDFLGDNILREVVQKKEENTIPLNATKEVADFNQYDRLSFRFCKEYVSGEYDVLKSRETTKKLEVYDWCMRTFKNMSGYNLNEFSIGKKSFQIEDIENTEDNSSDYYKYFNKFFKGQIEVMEFKGASSQSHDKAYRIFFYILGQEPVINIVLISHKHLQGRKPLS